MAKRVLVPLDLSPVAERILPLVAELARGAGATVRLLHVAPIPAPVVAADGRVVAYADQEMARVQAQVAQHLRAVEAHLAGVPVERVVRFGEPVEEILLEADAFDADLIAVSTTGRSALARLALGSVAERVLRKAPRAVLLYRSPLDASEPAASSGPAPGGPGP